MMKHLLCIASDITGRIRGNQDLSNQEVENPQKGNTKGAGGFSLFGDLVQLARQLFLFYINRSKFANLKFLYF